MILSRETPNAIIVVVQELRSEWGHLRNRQGHLTSTRPSWLGPDFQHVVDLSALVFVRQHSHAQDIYRSAFNHAWEKYSVRSPNAARRSLIALPGPL